ncbi:AraC family transcriptional regulator [Amorphus orientalis]|uniref:AraC-like DNA-binding protein n=1 Tax=Amorphus orientalis TaxID=649198 RepID=A0AAE3VNY0_9HYPH|nr:AraC family transcriptional regulator [Amorphus orientalis]MDQ0316119.1 AraC-like DNA-binding protein [Amorphus orientalis]
MIHRGDIALTRAGGLGTLPNLFEARAGERQLVDLFQQTRVPMGIIDAPLTPVPVWAMMTLFARAGRVLGDRTFGLEVGSQMTHSGFGLWVEQNLLAPTFGGALRRNAATIWAHQSGCRVDVIDRGSHVLWRYIPPALDAVNHHHSDHVIIPMVEFARVYLGRRWAPKWIEVNYPRDADAHLIEEKLQIPVRFGCEGVGLPVAHADLGVQSQIDFAQTRRVVTLREVVGEAVLANAPEPARAISAILAMRLLDGETDIEGTASLAGLSVRGLQRRLMQKGYTYREVVDAARKARAVRLLADTNMSVTAIGLSLGYDDHASFTRAFGRWTGSAPFNYRRQQMPQ